MTIVRRTSTHQDRKLDAKRLFDAIQSLWEPGSVSIDVLILLAIWYQTAAQAYKYVPFGPVDEVMPFLIRRAQVPNGPLVDPSLLEECSTSSSCSTL